ncbi:MAG: FliM/FliN family flagellar motor switch protein [Fibrobacteres bacterium]|jgi:flagellar motor switch protein FliN/FliY|nr:FliM/FliN family flagellar motor switch protein [Fibrobacterota bacterium]
MATEYKRSAKKKLSMDQLQDITLPVSLELGHKLMRVKDLLELVPGRIVKLDRLAGEPVDLVINAKTIAKGEVAVIDENFAVRIVTLLSPEERLKLL